MKVQIIYSSLSGCTRRLAEGIFDALTVEDKELYDLAAGTPALDGDVVLLGYWVDKGGPNAAMKAFMETIEAFSARWPIGLILPMRTLPSPRARRSSRRKTACLAATYATAPCRRR